MANMAFYIMVTIIVMNYLVGSFLSYLNIKNMSPGLPAEAEGIYTREKYRESQQYQKDGAKFSFISGSFSFMVLMIVLFTGGFGWLSGEVAELVAGPVLQALLFFGLLALASGLLSLPFDVYETFFLEEKYGFNKTSPSTFVLDKLKSLALGAILGGGLLAFVTWSYTLTGGYFWLISWALVSVFSIVAGMLYTSIILPLFNKLAPLSEGDLKKAIEAYADMAGLKTENIYVMDGSKRSSKANAFFSGFGPKKKIVLYDTLIEKHEVDELVAVLAHETGHYKKKHTAKGMALVIAQTGLMFFIFSLLVDHPALAVALGENKVSFHMGLMAFLLLYGPIGLVTGLLMNMWSRKNEFEADAFAMETYNGNSLARALKKIASDNLSNLSPHPAYVFFYYSHPPLLERIRKLAPQQHPFFYMPED